MNEEQLKERIWRIFDGVPLKHGKMTIKTTDTDKLLVIGWTSTVHFENLTKDSILRELGDLKEIFTELIDTYEDLKLIIKANDMVVEYHMQFNDSGKAGIGLCSEINGKLNWYL